MPISRLAATVCLCLLLQGGLAPAAGAAPAAGSRAGLDKSDANRHDTDDLGARTLAASLRLQAADADAGARREMVKLIDDPRFELLPADERRSALSALGWALFQNGDVRRARALYTRATALEEGDLDSWYQLMLLEMSQEQNPAAARALIVLAERWPEVLPDIKEDYIHRVRHGLEPAAPERVVLLQALFDANWTTPSLSTDMAWYQLAVARLDQGKPEAAVAPLKRVATPELLVWVRSDRRFDGLVDRDAWAFNAVQAAHNLVDALRQQVQLRPRDLDVRVQLSTALLMVGDNAQVVALADEVEHAIAAAPAGTPAFADMEDLAWIRNNRAIAYRRLGRIDEALAEFERARRTEEEGTANVSQVLNLGDFQCRLGRAAAARETIATVGENMSDFGKVVLNAVRLCAALAEDDARARDAALAFLRAHRKEGPLLYVEAMLRAGDLDAAALTLREALAAPDRRGEALGWAQEFLRGEPLAGDVAVLERRQQLLARADVRAAIDAVGRIEQYPLYLIQEM